MAEPTERVELDIRDDRASDAAKWAVRRHPDQAPEAPAELVERAKAQLGSHPELY